MNHGSTQPSALVVGLGDLGTRVLLSLARLPQIGRLIAAGRNTNATKAVAAQAQLIAHLSGGPESVLAERLDLEDIQGTAETLYRLNPEMIVMAASSVTWWRAPTADAGRAAKLAELPYGTWLPVLAVLVRRLMEARRLAGVGGYVVSLPFPDAVGPMLAPLNLAPDIGAGNVTEVAAKVAVLAQREFGAAPSEVDVRLIMHHAGERVAFGSFAGLSGLHAPVGEPPWLCRVSVRGEPLSAERVDALLRKPFPLPAGTATHELTAAATTRLVSALLSDSLVRVHAPAPGGLPGGYPLHVGGGSISLDLPNGLSQADAMRINAQAARWDGIERIATDGTVVFTAAVADATERILGMRMEQCTPREHLDLAAELLRRSRQ